MTFKIQVKKLKRLKKKIVIHWDKDDKYYDTLLGIDERGHLIWESGRESLGKGYNDADVIVFYGLTRVEEKENKNV